MSFIPRVKAPRQPDFAVTYYALGREPTPSGLHGYFINVGTFDTQREAIKAAETARLSLKSIGGVVRVHETGIAEPMLNDEARASYPRQVVSDDLNSMYNLQVREEREKSERQRKEIETRQKAIEKGVDEVEDVTTLEYYAKKHMNRRMLEDVIAANENNLLQARKKLADVLQELAVKEVEYPLYSQQWRDLLRTKLKPGTEEPFFLRERNVIDESK